MPLANFQLACLVLTIDVYPNRQISELNMEWTCSFYMQIMLWNLPCSASFLRALELSRVVFAFISVCLDDGDTRTRQTRPTYTILILQSIPATNLCANKFSTLMRLSLTGLT